MLKFIEKCFEDLMLKLLLIALVTSCLILFSVGMKNIAFDSDAPAVSVAEEVLPTEPEKLAMFDTSWIEEVWCQGEEFGTIRMIGAWKYADGIVRDEQGCLWAVDIPGVTEEDFLLLWLADNHTPDKTTDDIIIKTWREVH